MTNKNAVVGLFIVAGLFLFTVGLYFVGDRHQAFARHIDYYVEFKDLGGLSQGSKVKVGGLDAGEVTGIEIPNSPTSRFRVRFRIDQNLRALVRTDSIATIGTEGVVGDTFLLVRPGSSRAAPSPALGTLQSKEPVDLSDLLDRGSDSLNDADGTIKQLNTTLKGASGKLNGALDAATEAISNVNDVVVGLKQGRGTAGMLLRDESVATSVRKSVANAQQATSDLEHASQKADSLVSDLESRHLPQKADETMDAVHGAISNIQDGSKQLDQAVSRVMKADKEGIDAADNLRAILSNANAASENLVDDTEAFKHNLLVRGFFRNRGYYNLSDLPADKYRTDKTFTNPANHRAWLSADELFLTRKDGTEGLSQPGKLLLDATVTQLGGSALAGPIVIEGYSESNDPAGQFAFAHSRAILVSQYLQDHFQMEQRDLGVVSMKNLPPAGVGRPTWDGVCIVMLNRR